MTEHSYIQDARKLKLNYLEMSEREHHNKALGQDKLRDNACLFRALTSGMSKIRKNPGF
jgi:hypothetical protein